VARNAISNERANRIIHHLAECHREIVAAAEADELDTFTAADLGRYIDRPRDEINRRRAVEETLDAKG
jgi:hypothetical protein